MKEEMLNLETSQGRYVYTRSLIMMLYKAVVTEAPGLTLRVEHSISNGQFCRLYDASLEGNQAAIDSLVGYSHTYWAYYASRFQ